MIYKKYAIEIIISVPTIRDVDIENRISHNDINFSINAPRTYINSVKYLDDYSNISEFPSYFNTYEEAFDFLNKSYHYILRENMDLRSIKIVEVYNDIPIPIKILRKLKLKKLL